MPKVDTPRLAISFSFPDALPHAENDTPRFFHQHGVKGVLRVDVPASQHCDLVKITLQGRTVNKIVYGPPEYGSASITLAAFQSRESTFLELTDVHRLDHVESYKRRLSYQTPFNFKLPASLDPNQDLFQTDQYGLPPSLQATSSHRSSINDGTFASVDIVYQLKASIFQEDILVSSGTQVVQLLPFVPSIPPPLASDDFKGEYFLSRTRTLKKLFSKGKTLDISLREPKPMILRNDGRSCLHPVSITCRTQDITKPSPLCVTISWRLKSSTIVSLIPLYSLPTSRQAMLCPFLAEVTSESQTKSTDLSLADWQASTSPSAVWEKLDDVWLSIPQPKDSVPSFFTPLVCRRYSLELSIKIKGDGKAQFDFEIPIQFIWMENAGHSSPPCSDVELDYDGGSQELCPLYTR